MSQNFASLTNATNFSNILNSLFLEFEISTTGISWLQNITEFSPSFDDTSVLGIIQNGTNILIKGLKLKAQGLIYIGVDSVSNSLPLNNSQINSSSSLRVLQSLSLSLNQQITFLQLREGKNGLGLDLKYGVFVFVYNNTNSNFQIPIPRKNDNLVIHIAGSSENPGTNSKFTNVRSYTLAVNFNSFSKKFQSFIWVFLIVISLCN